jgi:hypothetical protein
MVRTMITGMVLLTATAALAETSAELCRSLVVQKLPAESVVMATRTTDFPGVVVVKFTPQDPGPALRPWYVEIDATTAGQSTTFKFVCAGTQKSFMAIPFKPQL